MSDDKSLPTQPVSPMTAYKRGNQKWRIVKESLPYDYTRIHYVIERRKFGMWLYAGSESNLEDAIAKLHKLSNTEPVRKEVVYEIP